MAFDQGIVLQRIKLMHNSLRTHKPVRHRHLARFSRAMNSSLVVLRVAKLAVNTLYFLSRQASALDSSKLSRPPQLHQPRPTTIVIRHLFVILISV